MANTRAARRQMIEDEGLDSPSTSSSSSLAGGKRETDSTGDKLTDAFKDLVENLSAKRGATRETALSGLRKLATENYLAEQLEGQVETVLDSLKRSLKRGTAAEARSAAELISLVFLSCIVDNEEIFQDVSAPLEEAIRYQKNPEARSACILTQSLCCFIASSDISSTMSCLALFEDIFTRPGANPDVAAAALDAWSLLATTVSIDTLRSSFERISKILSKLMHSDNLDLRLASGETLALLLENLRSQEGFDEGNLYHVTEILRELATDSNRHRAKKERTRQRAAFRDILRTVEEGVSPEETLKFKRETLVIDSWTGMRRIEAMRFSLGEGFHIHFRLNPIVRDVFGLPPPLLDDTPVDKLTALEKRHLYSPNSESAKARSRWLKSERQSKTAMVLDGFL